MAKYIPQLGYFTRQQKAKLTRIAAARNTSAAALLRDAVDAMPEPRKPRRETTQTTTSEDTK